MPAQSSSKLVNVIYVVQAQCVWTIIYILFTSSSLQAGPGAYTSDALQPRGLLCNPESPPI